MTNTFTTSTTFTRTDAEYLASKVVSDLRGMKAYYYQPDESLIWDYYEELAELLSDGYVASVEYGFKRNGQRVVTLFYELRTDGSLADGKSGGVYARADISGTTWFSFLVYSRKWSLPSPERATGDSKRAFQSSVVMVRHPKTAAAIGLQTGVTPHKV